MASLLFKHFNSPETEVSPSSALRFSINTGRDAAFGKKYNVDKVRLKLQFYFNRLNIHHLYLLILDV